MQLIPPSVAYMSVNRVNIGSDNGLSPIRRQAIIWTNAGLLSIKPLGTNFKLFINENAFKIIVCEMAAIVSRDPYFLQERISNP